MFVLVKAQCQTGDKPSAELIMAMFPHTVLTELTTTKNTA